MLEALGMSYFSCCHLYIIPTGLMYEETTFPLNPQSSIDTIVSPISMRVQLFGAYLQRESNRGSVGWDLSC